MKIILYITVFLPIALLGQTSQLDRLVEKYEKIDGDTFQEIDSLNQLAKGSSRSYPSISEKLAEKALRKSNELGYRAGAGDAYLNLSNVHRTRSDLTKALENGFRSYNLFAELGDSTKMSLAFNAVGVFYKDLNQADSSLNYLFKALKLNNSDIKARGTTLNNIGSMYLDMDELDSAEYYYFKSLDIREEIMDLYGLGITYGNLGIIAIQKENDPEKAKKYYEKSIEMKKKDGDFFQLAYTYINMGNLHRNIGKYEEARTYYQTALNYTDSAEAKGVKAAVYTRWARSERRAGNDELATEYDRLSSELYIEVLEERQSSELAQLQASYNLERKEQELLLLEKDRKLLLLQVIVLAFVVGFLLLLFLWQRGRAKRDKEIQKAKQNQLESDLRHKNSELSSFTINFIQKQEMMEQLQELSKSLKKQSTVEEMKKKALELDKVVSNQNRNDNEWENFRIYFEQVHNDFFDSLQAKHKGLTTSELRLAALVKMKLSAKETSSILGISPGSVKTARYRLRTKLGLAHEDSLFDFLSNL